MLAYAKTDLTFKRPKKRKRTLTPVPRLPNWREYGETDWEGMVAYSQALRTASSGRPNARIRTYDEAEWARFLDRYGRHRKVPLRPMPPVRTVNQQIAALLVED